MLLAASRPVEAGQYTFSARQIGRLSLLARRNSASTLYYRVRGADAQGLFVTYSQAMTTPAP
jgi:hypothetical protein